MEKPGVRMGNGGMNMQKKQLRILTVGAHPDDCELCTGGISIKYRSLGHVVKNLYTTNGDAGHHILSGKKLADIRAEEARNACAVAGIECEIMDNHDGYLEATIENREKMIRIIRKFRPDIIFTHRLYDYHPDHRHTAMLVQDASFLVRVPNICPDVPALDYSPIVMFIKDGFKKPNAFEPDIVVGIDDVIETKVKMIHCHKSQMYEWLPWLDGYEDAIPAGESERFKWLTAKVCKADGRVADRFRSRLIERYGEEKGSGIKYAEAFELSEYGGDLPEDQIPVYFPF